MNDADLIQLLADGRFHSGSSLGEALGVSRMAVNKRIDKLATIGLDIFRVNGKGYRLAQPLQLLQFNEVQQYLPPELHHLPLTLTPITGSTNDDLRALLNGSTTPRRGTTVLAEMQTAGRGRRGKPWFSPFGSNLYMSMYWPLQQGLNAAIGMSVALGLELALWLAEQGIEKVSVKWPNDVYIDQKKVAGILVELEGQADGEGIAIVGIGLNLTMPETALIDQPFTTVQQHKEQPINRNQWAAALVSTCYRALAEHDQHGLSQVVKRWPEFDRFYQQPVRVVLGQHEYSGVGRGIDEMGAFLVDHNGQLKRYFGGEISVRSTTHPID